MTDAASVLLIEDDSEIGALISRYLGANQISVTSVETGAAMDEALRHNTFDLVLLDLNLPRMDGREVLAQIKDDPALKTIPTVILTTSVAETDISSSYALQANCYFSKPVQLDEFESMVRSINDFWLTRARLPRQRSI